MSVRLQMSEWRTTAPPSSTSTTSTRASATKHVVVDLSLRVERGEIFGFLGPNGSGKTTSIRLMCGLLTPDSGSGTCLGYDIRRESEAIKRNVGYMTQRFSFWDDLTIRENLDFTARVYAMSDRRAAVDRALEGLGLTSRSSQLTGTLSGGWKQRLALAACMLHRPRLLLLDEPTAGVDPNARREFWEELHRLAAQGISVLVSTHYMDEAERCHKLAYIAYGRLLVQGTAAEVIAAQGLTTFSVQRPRPATRCRERLQRMPGVEQTVAFGETIHVTGKDAAALERSLREATAGGAYTIAPIDTGLEDVFIHLMQGATDNWDRASGARETGDRDARTTPARGDAVVVLVPALVGDGRQGVPAAAPRPRDVRDDRRHSDHPADALRLRDQHRPEAHADGDHRPPTTASSRARSWRRCKTSEYFNIVGELPDEESGPRGARARHGAVRADDSARTSRASCCAASGPSMLLEADASDPTATGAAMAASSQLVGRRRAQGPDRPLGGAGRRRRRRSTCRSIACTTPSRSPSTTSCPD